MTNFINIIKTKIENMLFEPIIEKDTNKKTLPSNYGNVYIKSEQINQYNDSKKDLLFEFNSLLYEYSKEELLYSLLLKDLKSNEIFDKKSNLDLCDKLKKLELKYGYNLLIEVLYDLFFNIHTENENKKFLNNKRIQKSNNTIMHNIKINNIFKTIKTNDKKQEKENQNENLINKPKINDIYKKNNTVIPLCEKNLNTLNNNNFNEKKFNLEMIIKKPLFVVKK